MLARNVFGLPSRVGRHPLTELERMARQMDLMTNTLFGRPGEPFMRPKVFPAINITEDRDKYYVRAELPGIEGDDIKVEVTGRDLRIAGERKIQSEGDNAKYHRREREAGKFSRVIRLPGDIEADSIDAQMVNGLLTVRMDKSAMAKVKQITVKAA